MYDCKHSGCRRGFKAEMVVARKVATPTIVQNYYNPIMVTAGVNQQAV